MTPADNQADRTVLDRNLVDRLDADVSQALDLATRFDTQFAGRVFVYTVFSAMEATIYRLKRYLLYFWGKNSGQNGMSSADAAALRDESYSIDDSGKARVRPMRTPLPANIRFAFDALARKAGVTCPIDFEGSGWRD